MRSQKVFSRIIFLIIIILIGALPHAYSQGNSNCNLVTCGDQTIIRGQSVQLSVSGATTYRWVPATGLSDPNSATPMAYPSNTTTYTVTGYNYSDQNLVVNGDFEQGNTGFSSGYSYNSSLDDEGTFYIDNTTQGHHDDFVGQGHTTGSDNFMMVNGAREQNKVVWQETISVVPNTQYCFSAWVSSLSSAGIIPGLRANLQFAINGIQIGNIFQSPSSLNVWENFYVLWDSGNATHAVITIMNTSLFESGNDFGLDDITFYGVVECPNTEQVTVNVENSSGLVNVSAEPPVICEGGSSHLHAEAITTNVVDFETHDFSQANFILPNNNAWVITTTNPYGGDYCMKSNCNNVNYGVSYIDAVVDVPYNAMMSFWVRVSSESSYDKFRFYIDGSEQGDALSGQLAYSKKSYFVTAGHHTFRWEYSKDGSVNSYDDCVYVDNIILYQSISISQLVSFNFESGNLSQFNNNLSAYPWVITTSYASTGSKSMRSNNQGVPSSSSIISFSYTFPDQGYIIFDANCMGEGTSYFFDKCVFYIDDVEQFSHGADVSGWHNYSFFFGSGNHTFKWVYTKDYSINNQGDGFAVDNIVLGLIHEQGSTDDNVNYVWSNGMTGPDITVSPTETTTYTVTATDENGTVIGTASQTVVVESVPVVSITTSTGETAICEEDTITLYASVSGTDFYLPGDILCTDGSIVHPSDWPCGKTAKAIVFYLDATGQHGWAIDLGKGNENSYTMQWSKKKNNVTGLQSYSSFKTAIFDMDGYSNTQKIRDFSESESSEYPAAWAVDFQNGWYLPSIGQLNILFGAYVAVNDGLAAVEGVAIDISTAYLWSSSVSNTDNAWQLQITNGYVSAESKTSKRRVRSIINF